MVKLLTLLCFLCLPSSLLATDKTWFDCTGQKGEVETKVTSYTSGYLTSLNLKITDGDEIKTEKSFVLKNGKFTDLPFNPTIPIAQCEYELEEGEQFDWGNIRAPQGVKNFHSVEATVFSDKIIFTPKLGRMYFQSLVWEFSKNDAIVQPTTFLPEERYYFAKAGVVDSVSFDSSGRNTLIKATVELPYCGAFEGYTSKIALNQVEGAHQVIVGLFVTQPINILNRYCLQSQHTQNVLIPGRFNEDQISIQFLETKDKSIILENGTLSPR